MVGQRPVELRAEGLKDRAQLLPILDQKPPLSALSRLGKAVKAERKGAGEQPRQALGKGFAPGDEADFPWGKAVPVEQNAVAFGQREGAFLHPLLAQLRLGVR